MRRVGARDSRSRNDAAEQFRAERELRNAIRWLHEGSAGTLPAPRCAPEGSAAFQPTGSGSLCVAARTAPTRS